MKHVLAATDLSERSAVALARAAMVAKGAAAGLTLVHAVDDSLPKPILQRRIAEAEEALRQQAEALELAGVACEVAVGDIFWAIHRVATKLHAGLIVAGDHRRDPLRDLLLDTTVERLVRVSAVPVLIARGPAGPYRHALVAVESEEGRELLDAVGAFGAARPAKATALHAFSAPAEGMMYYAGVERESIEDYRARIARRAHARLAAGVSSSPIPVEVELVEAAAVDAIEAFAQSGGCDLVAVSSHARRAAARGFLGSVSSALIRRGTVDLLVVPRVVSDRDEL